MHYRIVDDSVDVQAAYIALVVMGAAVLGRGDPLPERIHLNAGEGVKAVQAAADLASTMKPVRCESRMDQQDLLVDCVHAADTAGKTHAGTAAPFGSHARRVLGDLSRDTVIVLVDGLHLLVRAEAVIAFTRDYSFSFPNVIAGRRPTWAERRRGAKWVIEIWKQQQGSFYLDDI